MDLTTGRTDAPSVGDLARRVLAAFPEGRALPDAIWNKRHHGIQILLYVQVAFLGTFGTIRGYGPLHAFGEASVVAAAGFLAGRQIGSRRLRAGVATFGLVLSSALLVHLSGGTIEAHFHFFAMIAVITLYQDWSTFLLALGFVVLHHGLMGALDARSVYNHQAAISHPWTWALIHGLFVIFASVANVVAWRLNESARAQSELILNAADDGIFGVDLTGKIMFVNEAAARMIGSPALSLLGTEGETLMLQTGDGVSTSNVEGLCRRQDGSSFPVEFTETPIRERGSVVGTVVSFRDVTERKRAADELHRTLSLLSATLESTADGVLVVDNEGKITTINHQFATMWRIPDEIAKSGDDEKALSFVVDQLADPKGFLDKVRDLYAHPERESFDELRFKDGRVFERYSKPQLVDGKTVGRVWSFRDVTDRHRLDEMKNGFLSAVSHELRTPLTAVLGYAVTLERFDDQLPPVERKELLLRLSGNARRLQRLLADTIDLDRLSRGILEPRRAKIDVGVLIRQLIAESELNFARQIEIDEIPVVANIDPAKVERIVENLLNNAVRHTPEGTPIDLQIRPFGNGVSIVVEDRGPGVPDDFKSAIFEPFRQGPTIATHSPGVGIGLALVGRFAALHGGRAWVEDREGGGSSFHVELPDAQPEELSRAGNSAA